MSFEVRSRSNCVSTTYYGTVGENQQVWGRRFNICDAFSGKGLGPCHISYYKGRYDDKTSQIFVGDWKKVETKGLKYEKPNDPFSSYRSQTEHSLHGYFTESGELFGKRRNGNGEEFELVGRVDGQGLIYSIRDMDQAVAEIRPEGGKEIEQIDPELLRKVAAAGALLLVLTTVRN